MREGSQWETFCASGSKGSGRARPLPQLVHYHEHFGSRRGCALSAHKAKHFSQLLSGFSSLHQLLDVCDFFFWWPKETREAVSETSPPTSSTQLTQLATLSKCARFCSSCSCPTVLWASLCALSTLESEMNAQNLHARAARSVDQLHFRPRTAQIAVHSNADQLP